ncbi:Transcriptional regulator LysR family (fragment) [Cupriavidus necator]|uniref:Transcriptional regulator LysR family n=2 Tax=Cupriavidus necator TaxID=106590 RepID=A0A1K0IXY0_CUPNE
MARQRDAALAGHGIAVLPLFIVAADLAQGCLVEILPDEVPLDDGVFAVYPRTAFTSPKIRTLVQYLQHEMSPPPWELPAAGVIPAAELVPLLPG